MQKRRKSRAVSARVARPGSAAVYYVLLAAVVLFFCLTRLRLRDMPLERDEGEYAYAGQLILQGIPPYALAYNMKLPGTYVAYAAMMAVFGQTSAGIHLALALVNAISTVLLFFLARRILDSTTAIVAAAAYALLSTSPSVLGLAGHATHFVVLAALAGTLLLVIAISAPKLWKFFAAGALLGIAFLMKQPGIFFLFFGGVWLVFSSWRDKIGVRRFVTCFAVFAVGGALPFALTCFWIWKSGVFPRFWFWTFTYARAYGSVVALREAPSMFWMQFSAMVRPALPIWMLAALGLAGMVWKRRSSDALVFMGLFLGFAFFAVCPGFYFREHYFIPLLPAIGLFAGAAVSIFTNELSTRTRSACLRSIPVLLFIVSCGYALWTQWDFLFEMDPISASRAQYGVNPFPEAVQISDYLRAHTSPSSTLAILGSEPEIYFYAHRHSATGYIYTYALMEPQPYAPQMQEEMISEIERSRPEFVVLVNVPFSWLGRPMSTRLIFDWAQNYLGQNYQLDGLVDILDESQYHWGNDALNSPPLSPYNVKVFRRIGVSSGQS